ncbi:murein L,D-transpeptidase catalytic domain family protein, partial [Vibrio sp. 2175-1]
FIKKNGYLGRSWGCPALPQKLSREIIDTIKGGSVIYASA